MLIEIDLASDVEVAFGPTWTWVQLDVRKARAGE
jgi:hypothetical protein